MGLLMEDTWKTDDMGLASYVSMHLDIVDVAWEGDSCYWHFDDTDELEELVTEYLFGSPVADVRKFNEQNAKLKRTLFRGKTEQGVVSRYFPDREFGFIVMEQRSDSAFFHIEDVDDDDRLDIMEGVRVEFNLVERDRGPKANNIRVIALQSRVG
jgi:cold shock CspA family protein